MEQDQTSNDLEKALAEEAAELSLRLRELERLHHPVWVFDLDNARILWSNDSSLQVWQSDSKEELLSRKMGTDMSVSVSRRLNQYKADFAKDETAQFTEIWTMYPVGEPVTLNVVFSAFRLSPNRLCMLCEGSTDKAANAENLRSSEALLHTSVHISLYSIEGDPLYRNPAARSCLLYTSPSPRDKRQSRMPSSA